MSMLTPWLMEPGGSMFHSQGLSKYPLPNQFIFLSFPLSFILILYQIHLSLSRGFLAASLLTILKAFLPTSIPVISC